MSLWEFWIDVGGTFTDCVARTPAGELRQCKVLSSGVTKGWASERQGTDRLYDAGRLGEPDGFWVGYTLRLLSPQGDCLYSSLVTRCDGRSGLLTCAAQLPPCEFPVHYELSAGEEAPILAIRRLLNVPLAQAIPPVSVRLGTTRGTNALLTRRGARTALITTRGFADVLEIANQDRPRLFDLEIRKPSPLAETVVEIDERLDSDGRVLQPLSEAAVLDRLRALATTGIESIAICLLHAFANPAHEERVEQLARAAGFSEISRSSQLAPLIKIVSRGDTTVVDAYLNPILRTYLRSLASRLPGSTLRLMTSAGGLVDAARFVGKDSILSGPAGGVIGFSRVAEQAGFARSIGFDMGGTSTDVSRYDGRHEMEYETRKAGVRVVAPMLAIETVAAGGGSICDFDGVKLTVGPASAGAQPGPACYGAGGPLTVTDVNVFLGRVVPHRFPFPLDLAAVERRLDELCQRLATAGQTDFTPARLAEGFVQVANASMVRAIRNISVARGYDPRDYTLVTFGGAGAQHACAIARELGIRQVLSHPLSGLLSAYGMGLADVRRFREQAVLKPLTPQLHGDLQNLFARLATEAAAEVRAEGISAERMLPPRQQLDLRYKGVESTIAIECPLVADPTTGRQQPDPAFDYQAAYHQRHQALYGYHHAGRLIEVLAARVEVVGQLPSPPEPEQPLVDRRPTPEEEVETWFDGRPLKTGVFTRAQLSPGDRIAGPAIVCEPTSTVVIEPDFSARVLARGELLLEPGLNSAPTRVSTDCDPVQLEIFNNLFASIAEQMGITLRQTSFSTNVKERLDFSCAIFDPRGGLVVNAPHIPVHLGAMGETVRRILADNPDLAPGDVYVTNDPYRGGSHLPDVTVVTPVHDPRSGRLLFLTASRAHHAEIGGIVPGSMPPFSRTLADEGVLIRNFRLVERGVSREAELARLLASGPHPSRSVRDNLADVAAQAAANHGGVQQLLALVERYSLPVVEAYMEHIQQAAERKMRQALARLPDGVYRFTDHLDAGAPIAVAIEIRGDSAVVDFHGTGPVMRPPPGPPAAGDRGGWNLHANRAIVTAAVLYVFRCLINEDIPLNNGVLAPVTLVLPDCLLNPPEYDNPQQCAAIVGGNVETSQRVVDVLLGALQLAAASQGTMNNLTFGDDTFGYYETICGGAGATRQAPGADAVHTHMTNTRLTDPEVIERRYPVRLREFSIRRGSGGRSPAGRGHRGGDGIRRVIEFLKPLRVSLLTERRGPYPPFGLAGGAAGELGRNTLLRAGTDTPIDLGAKVQFAAEPGDVLTIETPGGGAWGSETPA